jgi:transcriptional regulator with XRE-family HTH domain
MNFASSAEMVLQARLKTGKSQKEFGITLEKDQSLVSRYERGQAMPSGDVIMHCMHILNAGNDRPAEIEIEYLLSEIRLRLADPAHSKMRAVLFDLLSALT